VHRIRALLVVGRGEEGEMEEAEIETATEAEIETYGEIHRERN
jgi:hypothetical protein